MTRKGKTGNVMKVIELGLKDRVLEAMKDPSFSAEAFARQLTVEGVKITSQSIRKFIKNTKDAQREIIAQDMKQAKEIMKITMDYQKELNTILEEVKQVKDEAKDEKDFTTYNQLVGRLLQGVELIAKLTGDIKPKNNVDIKIIYNEINSDVETKMKKINTSLYDTANAIDVDYEIKQECEKASRELQGEEDE